MSQHPTNAQVGDVWTVRNGSGPLRSVLIAKVADTHVVAWPIVETPDLCVAPGLQIGHRSGGAVTVWPQLATGLGLHVLDVARGWMLAPEVVQRVQRAVVTGIEECPLPQAPRADDPEASRRALSDLMTGLQRLCFDAA